MALKNKKKKTLKKVIKVKKVKAAPKKKAIRTPLKAAPKKRAPKKTVAAKKKKEATLGKVTHYFPQVRAAVIKVRVPFAVGDRIKIKGHTTDFKQVVTSMQIDRTDILKTKKGDEIGLLVDSRVRINDVVSKA